MCYSSRKFGNYSLITGCEIDSKRKTFQINTKSSKIYYWYTIKELMMVIHKETNHMEKKEEENAVFASLP